MSIKNCLLQSFHRSTNLVKPKPHHPYIYYHSHLIASSSRSFASTTSSSSNDQLVSSLSKSSEPSASQYWSHSQLWLSAPSETPSSWIDQLSDYFLSQPLQPLSYTSTVILGTLLIRSTTTLPISVWSRMRINRFERIVLPTFKAFRTRLALRAKRSFLDPAQIPVYQSHLQHQLKRELSQLISENKCKPSVTIIGSLAVHIPVIYTLTTVLRGACQRASLQSPLTLEQSPILGSSLIEPDLGLALICWAAFLVNVELNASFRYLRRSADHQSSKRPPDQHNASFLSRGLNFWSPEKIRTASFLAGIGMMGISSSQPALVLIYWLTSNCFSILQSLCFIYFDHRYQRTLDLTNSQREPIMNEKSHNPNIDPKQDSTNLRHRKSRNQSSSSLPPIL